jgi:hypothetical protein
VSGGLLRAHHHAEQVDRRHALEVGEVLVGQPRVPDSRDPRVVEHDVQPAEGLHREGDQFGDLPLVGDIRLLERGARAQGVGQCLAAVTIDVGDHDVRALGEEPLRGSLADPRGAAGDDRNLPGEILGHGGPFVVSRRSPYGATSSSASGRAGSDVSIVRREHTGTGHGRLTDSGSPLLLRGGKAVGDQRRCQPRR